MKRLIPLVTFVFLGSQLMAQSGDFMENIGKIYVVVAVIVLIFIGIVIYLIRLDRKIQKIEKEIK